MTSLDRNIELVRKELTWMKHHPESARQDKLNYCLVKIDLIAEQVMGLNRELDNYFDNEFRGIK